MLINKIYGKKKRKNIRLKKELKIIYKYICKFV